jgi:FkbM family methyltransferase
MDLYKVKDYFYPSKILDIGANIGQFHKLALKTFPSSFIFSIEANPKCEFYLNQITNNYHICLLAKDNFEYNFYSTKNNLINTGDSIYKELTHFYSDDQLLIRKYYGVKLDSLFDSHYVFDLIKIDTQGSELDIIKGGMNLCKKTKGILLEVSLTQYNKDAPLYNEVIQFMDDIGFKKELILDESYNHNSHQQDILFINQDI